jgi:uncharacterized membrane protein YqhA
VENIELYFSEANELSKLITIAEEIHLFFARYIFFMVSLSCYCHFWCSYSEVHDLRQQSLMKEDVSTL